MDTPVKLDLYQLADDWRVKAKWIVTATSVDEALDRWERVTGLDRHGGQVAPVSDNHFVVSKLLERSPSGEG